MYLLLGATKTVILFSILNFDDFVSACDIMSSFGEKESCDSLVQNHPLLDLQGVLAEEEDLLAAVHVDHGAAEVVVKRGKLWRKNEMDITTLLSPTNIE